MHVRASHCPSPTTQTSRRGRVGGSAMVLVLISLVVIFGGLAWVVQYLPTRNQPKVDIPDPTPLKPALVFPRYIAQWYPPKPGVKKEGEEAASPGDPHPAKDFEQGTDGYYDFLFKNVAETDIEVVFYTSDCDCASVEAGSLPSDEVDRLTKIHDENPGVPLAYVNKPQLTKLSREVDKEAVVLVKVGQGGVVRVNFNAKKSPGQELRVRPRVWYQPVGVPTQRGWQALGVPVMVRQPVHFHPQRVSVGILSAGAVVEGKLIAWSSTRSNLQLKLGNATDPFFKVETQPLSKEEYAGLEETLKAEKNTATVTSAVHVTVTVHESKDGKQLDLGAFYRKMPVFLDDILNAELQGPEIVGRIEGNIAIGGFDDQGRVRFKSFEADNGGKKVVEISADEKAELKTYSHQPSWLEVDLKLDKKNTPPKRRIWILEVRVPANTPAVRSFEEPDAIVLQVKTGDVVRLVRIPIEGHIGGR